MTKRFFIKDPEVVELSGVVIQSFYKDVTMFVFRGNGAEPMLCVAFVMLLSLVAAQLECMPICREKCYWTK